MKKKYKKNTITLSHTTTDQILENTLKQANELKKKGFGVFINIFAQDQVLIITKWRIGHFSEQESTKMY